jgi:hypothetical protein
MDRAFRSVVDAVNTVQRLRRWKVGLMSCTEPWMDTSGRLSWRRLGLQHSGECCRVRARHHQGAYHCRVRASSPAKARDIWVVDGWDVTVSLDWQTVHNGLVKIGAGYDGGRWHVIRNRSRTAVCGCGRRYPIPRLVVDPVCPECFALRYLAKQRERMGTPTDAPSRQYNKCDNDRLPLLRLGDRITTA